MEVFLQARHVCDQKADKPMEEQGVLGEVCVPKRIHFLKSA